MLEHDILERLCPTDEERRRVQAARESLEIAATEALAATGAGGVAQVQGSIAKNTWISGDTDMDCFLVLPQQTPEDSLDQLVGRVAAKVLQSPQKKYAQHPYVIGERDGFQVDLVPAYHIESPDQRLSAVDRTPLHTQWVLDHLNDATKDQVRLLKQWCKGVGVYGAETAIGGFSGYLLEVLVHHFGDFRAVLDWATQGQPSRIAITEDAVDDDVSPLVVVDPVDASRNCAAAVTKESLSTLKEAAKAYLAEPSERFFFPHPARVESATTLDAALATEQATWLGLRLTPQTDRLDLVYPQFQRASRVASDALERAGFPVRRIRVDIVGADVCIQWVLDDVTLPAEKTHTGPAARKEPNASKFRAKWEGHANAISEVHEVDGYLAVSVRILERTPAQWLRAHATQALTGKHVQKALGSALFASEPGEVDPDWAPLVADHVLARRPWER